MASNDFIIDGEQVNRLLEAYQLKHEMLLGQVFDIIEKKLIKSLADEIDKTKPRTVRFVNIEAIGLGPHRDFLYPICGGLAELIDSLAGKGIGVSAEVHNPDALPWNLAYRISKDLKGSPVSPTRKAA